MQNALFMIQSLIYGFLVTFVVSPMVISFIKREKVKQVILNYVDTHSFKSGTPTMGGIIFLISISVVSLICFTGSGKLAKMSIILFLSFGLVGFLDDFIKFKFKRNLGLLPYQKIIFQLIVSIFAGIFVYNSFLGGTLIVPFTSKTIEIGFWIIPLTAIIYIATTNSVNLTDGLDGLASSTMFVYLISFIGLAIILISKGVIGLSQVQGEEMKNLITLACVSAGAMLSFLIFNCFPAKIFMGDTGSLALGSLAASVMVMSGTSFYIPIIGIMFVLSSVSVILQVSYYKLTKKRIFLMAPLHHHFERRGIHEVRITMIYSLVTMFAGAIVIILNIL
ncbi:MAG: phospho-N-acetylmuramoyl-pentapeptide-transferase [Clostridia bacterium]|nr:phospho-N-acetylmuramoyl-pentapeptide-transferase [Clostridia bacterium]